MLKLLLSSRSFVRAAYGNGIGIGIGGVNAFFVGGYCTFTWRSGGLNEMVYG